MTKANVYDASLTKRNVSMRRKRKWEALDVQKYVSGLNSKCMFSHPFADEPVNGMEITILFTTYEQLHKKRKKSNTYSSILVPLHEHRLFAVYISTGKSLAEIA